MSSLRLSFSIILTLLLSGSIGHAQRIATVAGGAGISSGNGPSLPIGFATSLTRDRAGNLYFSVPNLNQVVKLDSQGNMGPYAGTRARGFSGDGGPAVSAYLNQPGSLAVDSTGNLYINDVGNHRIRKVSANGVITTIAGNGTASRGFVTPDGFPALTSPIRVEALAVDPAGTLYFAESYYIRKVNASGQLVTVAGTGVFGFGGDGGLARSATFTFAAAMTFDTSGNLYFCDQHSQRVRKIDTNGVISTFAGVGFPNSPVTTHAGDGGPAVLAGMGYPFGIDSDSNGNIFIAEGAQAGGGFVRKVNSAGIITTVAGTVSGFGFQTDGQLANTGPVSPYAIAVDAVGNIYFTESGNYRLRKVDSGGVLSTIAGNGAIASLVDGGPATQAWISAPYSLAFDPAGDLYFSDIAEHRVRKIDAAGVISRVSGTGYAGFYGDGGPALAGRLYSPTGLTFDSAGNLYIADKANNTVRKVDTSGVISSFAGRPHSSGSLPSGDGGLARDAILLANGVTALPGGVLYVVGGSRVRKVQNSIISTVAGRGEIPYSGDGGPALAAGFDGGSPVAIDRNGNIFWADTFNGRIRKVNLLGVISTVAGNGDPAVLYPTSIAFDAPGNLYITDNNRIRKLDLAGTLTTVAGGVEAGFSGDGGLATAALLAEPRGLAIDPVGNIYFADHGNGRIRVIENTSLPAVRRLQPAAIAARSAGVAVTVTGVNFTPQSVVAWNGSPRATTFISATSLRVQIPAADIALDGSALISVQTPGVGTYNSANFTITPAAPTVPGSPSPADGALDVPGVVTLGWDSSGAEAYDVYFGTTPAPPLVATVGLGSYAPGNLALSTTYYWRVVARNASGPASSPVWRFTTAGPPAPSVPSTPIPADGATGIAANIALGWAAAGALSYDIYFGTSANPPFAASSPTPAYSAGTLAAATTYYWRVVAGSGAQSVSSPTWRFTTAGPAPQVSGLRFVPVVPCRIADTRAGQGTAGEFGPPAMNANSTRDFAIPLGRCSIPSTAQAYSLNITVVPAEPLSFLTLWPTGQPRPLVSTLNSFHGGVVSNAAIVPAGAGGAVSIFATNRTDVIVDINGYFDSTGGASFYVSAPCRVADTRLGTAPFGAPTPAAGAVRSFPLPGSGCGLPGTAAAYSLNVTAVPRLTLGFLTLWASGAAQPFVSTLNSFDGSVVANAALVPAGSGGAVSAFVTDASDVILDSNGYFAAPGGVGELRFYAVSPCRVADTRVAGMGAPIIAAAGSRDFSLAGICGVPAGAKAYSLNVTAVPTGGLSFLSLWPAGQVRPFVSTLNSFLGRVTANAALVPAGAGGAVSVFATDETHVILDVNGYFQ